MIFNVLAILSAQFSGIKYIHIIMQLSHHPFP